MSNLPMVWLTVVRIFCVSSEKHQKARKLKEACMTLKLREIGELYIEVDNAWNTAKETLIVLTG